MSCGGCAHRRKMITEAWQRLRFRPLMSNDLHATLKHEREAAERRAVEEAVAERQRVLLSLTRQPRR